MPEAVGEEVPWRRGLGVRELSAVRPVISVAVPPVGANSIEVAAGALAKARPCEKQTQKDTKTTHNQNRFELREE
jgi:hypothetical protein